jgi:hypothetical protein
MTFRFILAVAILWAVIDEGYRGFTTGSYLNIFLAVLYAVVFVGYMRESRREALKNKFLATH